MKVVILTFGSRGDVEPPLALANGLRQAGHRVTLVAPAGYAAWIASYGVEPALLRFDMAELLHRLEKKSGGRPRLLSAVRVLRAEIMAGARQALKDYAQACSDADFIVQCGPVEGGVDLALQRGVPMAFAFPYPYAPTGAFPSYLLPWRRSLGSACNRWSQKLALQVSWRTYGPPLNRWRSETFGLPPWRSYREPMEAARRRGAVSLYAYSRHVLPKPNDWGAADHLTGYWFLPPLADWKPDPALQRFLDTGEPPVFIGFGSMPSARAEQTTGTVLRALRLAGRRGVLFAAGGGSLARVDAPPHVHFVDGVPHRWLFPRMAAVVHHGGAGTTAAVLNAGVPGIVLPMGLDQFAWAQRIQDMGVGVRGAHLRKLTAENLAEAIRRTLGDTGLATRAKALGETIRSETGVENAIALIERCAESFHARRRSAFAP